MQIILRSAAKIKFLQKQQLSPSHKKYKLQDQQRQTYRTPPICLYIETAHFYYCYGRWNYKRCGSETTNWPRAGKATKKCITNVEGAAAAAASPKFSTSSINDLDSGHFSAKKGCALTQKQFIVQLSTDLEPNELVGLTGDSKALGEWQLERSVVLHRHKHLQWSANVALESCHNIKYRYFVYVVDSNGRKQIRRWETQLQPRTLQPCNSDCLQVDRFGEVTMGEQQVNRGFLTNESILQLKFEREKMFQVIDIEKFDPENILIKIVPLKSDLQTALEAVNSGINIETVKFKYGESHLQPQHSFGIAYKRGEILIFHITVPHPLQNDFALVFHALNRKPIGKAIVKSTDLIGSDGVLELTVTEPSQDLKTTIAKLTLPYVIVKPYNDIALDFRSTYAHYWPKNWPYLNVGHRGNGKSFVANPPAERENTIASFLRAYESFADMIELDVHLTSDGVPIIYHDFGMRTAPQGKVITSADQLEFVLLKDISYAALKQLRIFAVINDKPVEYPSHESEPRLEHRIFPRLIDVLKALPRQLGIDVEIKWPQERACGKIDALQTIDKNFFVDRVFSIIVKYGCGRPMIFSSFDADICTMLRFKQNVIPVMFLTNGETKKYMPYIDLRTRTFENAINNAQAFELAGTAPHAEDFLGDNGAQIMQKARNMGQIALVWGDDLNSKERVKYFGEIGATAICYDRADLHMPDGKKRSFFNSKSLMEQFEEQCRRDNSNY